MSQSIGQLTGQYVHHMQFESSSCCPSLTSASNQPARQRLRYMYVLIQTDHGTRWASAALVASAADPTVPVAVAAGPTLPAASAVALPASSPAVGAPVADVDVPAAPVVGPAVAAAAGLAASASPTAAVGTGAASAAAAAFLASVPLPRPQAAGAPAARAPAAATESVETFLGDWYQPMRAILEEIGVGSSGRLEGT